MAAGPGDATAPDDDGHIDRQPVRRRLADDREILYFDDEPGRRHDAADHRELPSVETVSELRDDPVLGETAILAAHRQSRTFLPPASMCPLCPSRGEHQTEVPDAAFDIVVFENRFPSVSGDQGRCEVVVPTDDHEQTVAQLPRRRLRTLVDAWAQRSEELAARPEVRSVSLFENRGEAVGVTLHHTHQQIYALPVVPPITARLASRAAEHAAGSGGCVLCDQVEAEIADGSRLVAQSPTWTLYVPHAARWPYQVRVVPRRHMRVLPELDDAERDELARVWQDLFRRYDALDPDVARLPTIAAWHQVPREVEHGHLFGEVFTLQRAPGRLKYLAGSESAFGQWVLDVAPEAAAEALRELG